MTWPASAPYPENDCHENFEIGRRLDGSQMLCLQWHRLPDGRAAKAARTQDLSAAVQTVFWQGSDNAGLNDRAPRFCERRGWTGLQGAGNLRQLLTNRGDQGDRLQPLCGLHVRLVCQLRPNVPCDPGAAARRPAAPRRGQPSEAQPGALDQRLLRQFVEPLNRVLGDARQNVGEPGLRIDIVEFCRGDQAQHEGGALTAAV